MTSIYEDEKIGSVKLSKDGYGDHIENLLHLVFYLKKMPEIFIK